MVWQRILVRFGKCHNVLDEVADQQVLRPCEAVDVIDLWHVVLEELDPASFQLLCERSSSI